LIDLQAFKDWADFCDTNLFTFDGIFDFQNNSVFNAFNTVSLAGRASLTVNGDQWSIVVDDPAFRTAPVQMFTARNSKNFKSTKIYPETLHLVRAPFPNRDKDYIIDVAEVFNDGFNKDNATNILESQEMRGLTDFASVHKAVRFDMLRTRFRPEVYEIEVSLDALVARRGDKVRVNHHLLVIGLGGGRVTQLTTDVLGNITGVTLDEDVTFEFGKTYGAEFRNASDTSFVDIGVANPTVGPDIQTKTFLFTGPVDASAILIEDLMSFGEATLVTADMVVTHIQHRSNLSAIVTMVDEAPEIQQALASDVIPPFTSQIKTSKRPTLIPPSTPVIVQTRRTLTGFSQDDSAPIIALSVDVQPGQAEEPGLTAATIGYRAQYRTNDPQDSGLVAADPYRVQQVSTSLTNNVIIPTGATKSVLLNDPADLSAPAVNEFYARNLFQILDIADAWSISTWVNPSNMLLNQGIFSANFRDGIEIVHLSEEATGRIGISVRDSTLSTVFENRKWNAVLTANTWTHLVVTWNGTDLALYIDSVLTASDLTPVNDPHTMIDSLRDITYGANWSGALVHSQLAGPWIGHLGHLAIWDEVITAAEVASIFNPNVGPPFAIDLRQNTGNYVSSENLQHYWRPGFTDIGINDISGNVNNRDFINTDGVDATSIKDEAPL